MVQIFDRWGCGGTLARLVEREYEIFVAVFSIASSSLPAELPSETLKHEYLHGMQILGIPNGNASVRDYPVRRLDEYWQSILEELIVL